jgi:protein tyrosine phosphatase
MQKNSFYKQGNFPFKDHEATSLNLIRTFCEDSKIILDEDKDNIIVIHRKEGKGRTGLLFAVYYYISIILKQLKNVFYITAL